MASHRIAPENTEERLIHLALAGGWVWYALGALYVVGPLLGISLLGMVLWRRYAAGWSPGVVAPNAIPAGVWAWIVGMMAMLIALWMGHLNEELSAAQTLKSTIGWLKGWALLAIFPMAGACLRIRPELVIRSFGVFALQTLVLIPFLVLAALAHLPPKLFVSPLQILGGPGPEFFSVYLYIVDPSNGASRWQFIAPWAPAAGMLGNLIFVLASFETDRRYRMIGLLTGLLMCFMTKSRMAMLFLIVFPCLLWTMSRLSRPRMLAAGAASAVVIGVLADIVITTIQDGIAAFRGARADSTRVREALGRIAIDRWWDEAVIWGHGIVERGPHFVEYMPIGSHHTWYGLLYVKGLVGALALALPLLWSIVEMLLLSQVSWLGRVALSFCLMLVFYSFGENLEILSYLFWPGLIVLGIALRPVDEGARV